MITYLPVELHTHTNHSDGSYTVTELVKKAKKFGYSAIFLSDHNTISPYEEVINKHLNKILPVFKGVEWTTFYGHMVILGCNVMSDWTKATKDNMDECIAEIKKEEDVVIGIAHPYAIGNPICTGCHWEFNVKNWDNIDYIEIYNSANPQDVFWNEDAYLMWTRKINAGYKIACTSGRDWHRDPRDNDNIPLTYLGIDGELNQTNAVKAIKKGRVYTSLGPVLDIKINVDGNEVNLGDTIESNKQVDINIKVLKPVMNSQFDIEVELLRFYNSPKDFMDINIEYDDENQIRFISEKGFFRFEILGHIKNSKLTKLVVTSPVYVE